MQKMTSQIEVNNIASSFGILSTKCTALHEYVLRKLWRNQAHDDDKIEQALKSARAC